MIGCNVSWKLSLNFLSRNQTSGCELIGSVKNRRWLLRVSVAVLPVMTIIIIIATTNGMSNIQVLVTQFGRTGKSAVVYELSVIHACTLLFQFELAERSDGLNLICHCKMILHSEPDPNHVTASSQVVLVNCR